MSVETDDGPSPSDLEHADDARYAHEFNTLVATFRVALEMMDCWKLTARVAAICRGDYPLSYEQSVIYVCDTWGYPAVLRALATAIAHPAHILGDLEGD
tara:strand:+ start:964 stop:1260 length:297 start_codon:yes stop_codon:yes gene_type:complete